MASNKNVHDYYIVLYDKFYQQIGLFCILDTNDQCKWMLQWHDHFRYFFVCVQPETDRLSAREVYILQKFCSQTMVRNLENLWRRFNYLNGLRRHPQSQGLVERGKRLWSKSARRVWIHSVNQGTRIEKFYSDTSKESGKLENRCSY